MISEAYRELNRDLHKRRADYGTSGQKWATQVDQLAQAVGAVAILDYGCGKQTLADGLPNWIVKGYDPCIEGLDEAPEPHDFVTCTDVLEHVEPENLDAVLDELQRLSLKGAFLTVATRPAAKTLADGRNAHLIQEPSDWWLPKIMARWDLRMFQAGPGEFAVFVVPKAAEQKMKVAA